ncbi:MAG TPA: 3-oxoacyl-[acyl-carrier-protein] reductase [Firmicutes bacterium]|nr:3-oxoacyl-[acyl-carrier-protein] reductase [Bacillota bacterium]
MLDGKVAIVTGGARGIGRAIGDRFLNEGAIVCLFDIMEDELKKVKEGCKSNNLRIFTVDISDTTSVGSAVNETMSEFGRVDILVNNAGINRDNLLMRMTDEEWDRVIEVNLKGTYNCIKAVIRPMLKARWGRIINITSVIGMIGNAGQANYSASKAGIIGLTKSAAKELASRGITVNCIAPGFIETPMTDVLPDDVKDTYMKQIPMGKFGKPDDVSGVCAFLSGDDASYITGQVIVVDGGMVM